MGKTLYLECYCGISGDMSVASLIDLGADIDILNKSINSIPINGFKTKISRVNKAGLDACDFSVELDNAHENCDHDMEYLHGKKDLEHSHIHHHEHRGLNEIIHIIEHTNMTDNAKNIAINIFNIIAESESKAHGVEIKNVHFHEVGAIDSIVDIIAFAVCMDNLNITKVIVPKLYEGSGTIKSQHGILPIPVPAVANIVAKYGIEIHIIEQIQGEFVTPTGAAIVAAIRTENKLPDNFKIEKIGIGAGKRTYERPSILRAMLINENKNYNSDFIYKLESNIDDCTGETFGFLMDRLYNNGAKDVSYTPIFMKKNRPAYQLNVVCNKESISDIEEIIFKETTTIGIRKILMERTILNRKSITFKSSYGDVKLKICTLPNGEEKVYPEYESISALSQKYSISYFDLYQDILAQYKKI